MKLLRDDMVRAADAPPLALFEQGIRAEETRARYTRALRQVACEFLEDILEGTFEERVAQMVKTARDDPGWARDLMISLAWKLRERTKLPRDHRDYLNPASFGNYFNPVKKLFDMNDVAIQWKRVRATYPELDNMPDTAGWTREEIARMLRHARDVQDRAVILVLASSGVRAGALDPLNWGDLTPVYRDGGRLTLDPGGDSAEVACAMLEVYRGSSEGYTAFITPEAFSTLQEYARVWSERMGRQAGPGDPIFIATRSIPRRSKPTSIQARLMQVVEQAGLRDGGRQGKMHRVPLMNGFRRFYNKTCKEALAGGSTLGSLIKHEFMMGHRGLTTLDENYFKADALELAAEYVKAVPDLTIDDADRLRLSNRTMAGNIQRMEDEKDGKIARLEAEAARMRSEVERVRREKDEAVERMREEVAELKGRRERPVSDMLAILRESSETDGVSDKFMESLTGMLRQLGASQEASIREMRDEYDTKIEGLVRRLGGLPEGAGEGRPGPRDRDLR